MMLASLGLVSYLIVPIHCEILYEPETRLAWQKNICEYCFRTSLQALKLKVCLAFDATQLAKFA